VRIQDQPNKVIVEGDGELVKVVGQGPQGPRGVVAATAPITYDSGTQTVAIEASGYVASVNGDTGVVVLDATDVGAYPDTNPSSFVDAAGAAAAAPVQSVDSLTGAVDLVPRYAVASDTAPVSPFVGQRWVQTSTGRLAYWTGSEWVEIGALGLDLSVAAADPAFTGAFLPLGAIPTGGATGQVLAKASGTNYDTAWGERAVPWVPIVGEIYGHISNSTATFPLDTMTLMAMYFPQPTVVDALRMDVSTAGAAGAVYRLGIYAATSTGSPGALIVDAGTVSATTTGNKLLTITPVTLSGLFYTAAAVQGATSTARSSITVASAEYMPKASTITTEPLQFRDSAVSRALPSTYAGLLRTGSPITVQVRIG
jgi:hypothetical protein